MEEPTKERLGERTHKSGSSDTGEDASDRVRQRPDRALDRSEDPGDAQATVAGARALALSDTTQAGGRGPPTPDGEKGQWIP